MVNFIGGHFSRNGVAKNWPARGIISYAGNGLSEQNEDTIVVWRDGWVPERPPDLYTNPLGNTMEFAQYYYDNPDNVVQSPFKQLWTEAKANHPEIDYFVFTNEACGTNRHEVETYIAYERNMCELAHADGFKLGIGKFANGTPQWDSGLWQELYAPWIVEAWEKYGAIYTRHVYGLQGDGTPGDLVDADGNIAKTYPGYPYRVVDELEILRGLGWGGGLLICECGLDGGYGHADWDRFYFQITKFAQALRSYADNVIGFAWWECGNTNWEADYTQDLKECSPYMAENSMPKWEGAGNTTPPTEPPVTEPPESIDFPNGCFSDGWQTLLGGNQQPNEWLLSWNQEGSLLPNGEYATRSPECVHKEDWQLPPNEQPGGDAALILCGDKTYKMFGDYGKWGAMLSCVIDGLTPDAWYYIGGNFQVHYEEVCNEIDDILIDFSAGDDKIQLNTDDLHDRKWIYSETMCQADADGKILVDVHVYTKYQNRRTLFVDKFTIEPVEEVQPPTEKHKVVIVKIPQEYKKRGWLESADWSYDDYKRTQTASHDDMMTMLRAGNAASYAVIIDPWLDSQQEAIEVLSAEGYTWKRLELGTPPNTEVLIDIPHMTQVGNVYRNDCGAACAAMVINGMTSHTPSVDQVSAEYQNPPNSYMTFAQIGYALKGYDMNGTYERPFMSDKIDDSITIGLPVIALVHYPAMPQRFSTFSGSHFIAIYGTGDGYFLYRDPLQVEGSRLEITHDELTAAMAQVVNDGNMAYQGMMCEANFEPPTEPEPPTGETVNVTDWIRGTNGQQFDMEYATGTQTTMISHQDDGSFLYVKGTNGEYERLWVAPYNGEDWIWRADDTSESPTRMYAHYRSEGGALGAPWFPCNAVVNHWYETGKFVQHFLKDGCVPQNSGNVVDKIRLTGKPYQRTYPMTGQTLTVITLEWSSGEQYDFNNGNVAFRDATRNFEFMQWLEGRQPLPIKKYDCFGW